jgi:hypothetical protein
LYFPLSLPCISSDFSNFIFHFESISCETTGNSFENYILEIDE